MCACEVLVLWHLAGNPPHLQVQTERVGCKAMFSRNLALPRVFSLVGMAFAMAVLLAQSALGAAMPYGQSEQAVTGNVPNAYPGAKRIVAQVNANNLAILKGNTRPEASAKFDRGAVTADFPMRGMVLVLRRSTEQQAAFDAFVQSEYETGSPNYHQWLTPEEVGERFGPAQEDVDTISQWLTSQGFTVDAVTKDRMTIRFSGTAGQVKSAFHTEIHRLSVNGENHIANMSDPAIPAALTPVVVGVQALHNFFPHPMHRLGGQVRMDKQTHTWKRVQNSSAVSPKAASVNGRAAAMSLKPNFNTTDSDGDLLEDIAPYDFATIYNVLPLWQAATPITGAGQKIAIVATSNINLDDVTAFRSAFGLPAYPSSPNSNLNQPGVSVQVPPTTTDPGDCSSGDDSCMGDLIENSLDVEWAGAVAPGAHIILVPSSGPATIDVYTEDPVWTSASYIVDNDLAPIMNVSYGMCELGLGTAGNTGYNDLWQTAASEGIAVFVAAGDEGSASCDFNPDDVPPPYEAEFGLAVSGVASTPYNTAVGGTDFNWGWTNKPSNYWNSSNDATNLASAKGYIPEFPWNSTCSNPLEDSVLNSYFSTNYDAATICDDIGTGVFNIPGASLISLVQVTGGSGGASNCTVNDNAYASSCTGGYAKPSWQTGITGIPSDGKRDIPDVSFFAANGFSGSAYLICVSAYGGPCTYSSTTEPIYSEVGGTSVSSPAMAGVMALINQKTGANQGNPNAALYKLAAKESYGSCSSESVSLTASSCSFYDIDTGTNAMPCKLGDPDCSGSGTLFGVLDGYAGGAGFDLATGLGSLNVANVVNNFTTIPNADIFVSETALSFGPTAAGDTSAAQTVTVSNTSNQALSFTSAVISGTNASLFSETNNCGSSLAAGASCTINVTFKPTTSGNFSATLTLTDGGATSPQTVSLTGVTTQPTVGFSSGSLTFASTLVGETATAQSVTLTNTGSATLTITSVGVTGTGATSFGETNNCVGTVLAGKSCTISVTFAPPSAGSFSAAVSVTDNATGSPQSVSLTGVGVTPGFTLSANPGTISLVAGATTGNTSAISVTPTNGFTGPVSLTCSISTTATSAPACTVTPSVTVSGTTAVTGTLTIATTASTSAGSYTVTINGSSGTVTGSASVALTVAAPAPPSFTLTSSGNITVSPGATTGNTATITVAPANGFTGSVSLSCAISPAAAVDPATCSVPASVTISGATNQTATLTVTTTAATSAKNDTLKSLWPSAGGVALALVLFFGVPARNRKWQRMLSLFILLVSIAGIGCGGGSSSGGGGGSGGNTGTSAGAYTVTVTGTSGSITQTAKVSLTVQ